MNEVNQSDREPEIAPPVALCVLRCSRPPGRDLWPGIAARIQVQQARRRRRPWIAAAALAASLVLVLGLTVALQDRQHATPRRAPAEIAALTLPQHAHELHPETRALVRANLKLVNNAEAQLKRALEQDPDGEYLRSLLASARQQKQDLRVALADGQ
jgi:hypothetical protein